MLSLAGLRVMRAACKREFSQVSADTRPDCEAQAPAIAGHDSLHYTAIAAAVTLLPALDVIAKSSNLEFRLHNGGPDFRVAGVHFKTK